MNVYSRAGDRWFCMSSPIHYKWTSEYFFFGSFIVMLSWGCHDGELTCFNCCNSFTPRHLCCKDTSRLHGKDVVCCCFIPICHLSVQTSDGPNPCKSDWSSGELWVPSHVDEHLNFLSVTSSGNYHCDMICGKLPLCYMQRMHVYLPLKATFSFEKMKTI